MKAFTITKSITDRSNISLPLYFKDIYKLPVYNADDQMELAIKVQQGDKKAETQLIQSNLRFVISVAKLYQKKGLDLTDLIQEGNIGLIEAAKHFDPSKGIKFITYAVWWIRQSIMIALSDKGKTVRIPVSKINIACKLYNLAKDFEQRYERQPNYEELSSLSGFSIKKIRSIMCVIQPTMSLDKSISQENSSCLIDIIANPNTIPVTKSLLNEDLKIDLETILKSLPNRNSDIIRLTYGIQTTILSNEDIAALFGIGKERVRQIQIQSIEYIKKKFKTLLKDYIE